MHLLAPDPPSSQIPQASWIQLRPRTAARGQPSLGVSCSILSFVDRQRRCRLQDGDVVVVDEVLEAMLTSSPRYFRRLEIVFRS